MSLFDFFKSNPQAPAETPHTDDAEAGNPDQPVRRFHHYALAHYALRQFALHEPKMFYDVLSDGEHEELLGLIFQSVCEHARPEDGEPDFAITDLQVYPLKIGSHPAIVIEMPPPQAVTEAYFTALVLLEDSPPSGRYFTLENGMTLEGAGRTVLCEWNTEQHMNLGDGPEPTIAAFVAALARQFE